MVVVLIIAILIAIAIPTFLGARQRAQDRAAQSDLRNGLTAEKTYYTDAQEYSSDSAALTDIESSLDWGGELGVTLSPDSLSVCLDQTSKSGTTFAVMDISAGSAAGTYFAKSACPTPPDAVAGATVPGGFETGGW